MVVLGLTLVLSQGIDFRERVPMRKPFNQFPMTIGHWHGDIKRLEQKFIDELDFSDYLIADYTDGNHRSVNIYVAYYENQRKGESIHSPASCLPGHGWHFNETGAAVIQNTRHDRPPHDGQTSGPAK